MHIENELKLDFSDVLIRPKRSTLESRADVDLFREIELPWVSYRKLRFIPIMNANMGTSGTFEVAEALLNAGCLATVHKHYSVDEWELFLNNTRANIDNMFYPIGINMEDTKAIGELNNGEAPNDRIKCIMIDVANGYSQKFIDHVARVREKFPGMTIAAGNVVTAEMAEALILAGADIVKCGIGSGSVCILEGQLIKTKKGYKVIEDITVGDEVFTHAKRYKKVINTFTKKSSKLLEINGIKCTPDHKFWVVNVDNRSLITESNINTYAYWLEAQDLDEELHLIVSM